MAHQPIPGHAVDGPLGRWLWLCVTGIALSGCVMGAKLREDAKLIEKKIANARERGSYRCAPAELARAEAQLEFLNYELAEGDFRRASWHHRAALENINRAL